jgi:hypothetical protein
MNSFTSLEIQGNGNPNVFPETSRGEEVEFTVVFTGVTYWSDLESSVAIVMMGGMEAVGVVGGMEAVGVVGGTEAVGVMEAMGGKESSAVVILKRPERSHATVVIALDEAEGRLKRLIDLRKQYRGLAEAVGGMEARDRRDRPGEAASWSGRGRRRHGGS